MTRKVTIGRFNTREELERRIIDYVDNGLSFNKTARNCEVSPTLAIKVWVAHVKAKTVQEGA